MEKPKIQIISSLKLSISYWRVEKWLDTVLFGVFCIWNRDAVETERSFNVLSLCRQLFLLSTVSHFFILFYHSLFLPDIFLPYVFSQQFYWINYCVVAWEQSRPSSSLFLFSNSRKRSKLGSEPILSTYKRAHSSCLTFFDSIFKCFSM